MECLCQLHVLGRVLRGVVCQVLGLVGVCAVRLLGGVDGAWGRWLCCWYVFPVGPQAAGRNCGDLHVPVVFLLQVHPAVPLLDIAQSDVILVPFKLAPGIHREPGSARGVPGQPLQCS